MVKSKIFFREKIYDIIFEADTPAGKAFDVLLIVSIILSVLVVMLDSVQSIHQNYGELLYVFEWFFTVLFTVEYALRLYSIERPELYATSFYGIVDLLAIMPTYMSLIFPGAQHLMVIRVLRVLRIFRVFKIVQYIGEANLLMKALNQSRHKIIVFLFGLLTLVVIMGSFMYLLEGEYNSGFTSIPKSVYWAIVTMTTVGYGDISPETPLGQLLAAVIMIMGYSIIAVPTGIVTAEIQDAARRGMSHRVCSSCSEEGHDEDAGFCKYCGHELED